MAIARRLVARVHFEHSAHELVRVGPRHPRLRARNLARAGGLIACVIPGRGRIVGSDYELNQHTPFMKMCRYSNEQLAEVSDWRRSTLFDDKQRALLGYVEQMANGGNVDDPTFAEFSRFFTPQQIIEISYTVGAYYSTGLLTKALKIQPETDGRLTVPGEC